VNMACRCRTGSLPDACHTYLPSLVEGLTGNGLYCLLLIAYCLLLLLFFDIGISEEEELGGRLGCETSLRGCFFLFFL